MYDVLQVWYGKAMRYKYGVAYIHVQRIKSMMWHTKYHEYDMTYDVLQVWCDIRCVESMTWHTMYYKYDMTCDVLQVWCDTQCIISMMWYTTYYKYDMTYDELQVWYGIQYNILQVWHDIRCTTNNTTSTEQNITHFHWITYPCSHAKWKPSTPPFLPRYSP